jgi:hypothetical protein
MLYSVPNIQTGEHMLTKREPMGLDFWTMSVGVVELYEHPLLGDEAPLLMRYSEQVSPSYTLTQWWDLPERHEVVESLQEQGYDVS